MELVAGATGSLGGRITRELLRHGGKVRALARSSAGASELERAGAEVALGNLKDPESLRLACRGVDVVISTASATRRSDDTPENVDLQGNIELIDAARAAGVRRYVLVSTLGATPDSPVPAFRAKAGAEAYLKQSGMEFVILQSDAFMDIWFGMLIEAPIASGAPETSSVTAPQKQVPVCLVVMCLNSCNLGYERQPIARNSSIAGLST